MTALCVEVGDAPESASTPQVVRRAGACVLLVLLLLQVLVLVLVLVVLLVLAAGSC